MESVIKWINIKDRTPTGFGWKLVVLRPSNFYEFENDKKTNDWTKKCGFDKIWFNDNKFWQDRVEIMDRVIYWAEIPKFPLG